jgi:hypothetical protein
MIHSQLGTVIVDNLVLLGSYKGRMKRVYTSWKVSLGNLGSVYFPGTIVTPTIWVRTRTFGCGLTPKGTRLDKST